MRGVPVAGIIACVLGAVVLVGAFASAREAGDGSDPSMLWERRLAAGATALLILGPIAVTQLVATLLAGGDGPGWLWGWLVGAPTGGAIVGTLAAALRGRSGRAPAGPTPSPPGAVAQFWANVAWAEFGDAGPGWELRRTVPMPSAWPPPGDGVAIWYLYAERSAGPTTFEVSAPWARLVLAPAEEKPETQRLADALEPIGTQGIEPLDAKALRRARAGITAEAIRRSASQAELAAGLERWRASNGAIARHPVVAPHFPGA